MHFENHKYLYSCSLNNPILVFQRALHCVFNGNFPIQKLKRDVAKRRFEFHMSDTGNANLLVGGTLTVPSTSCQTGLELSILVLHKYFVVPASKASLLGG
jgi:hypothetical protein